MDVLIIADKDKNNRMRMAELFPGKDHDVKIVESVGEILKELLKRNNEARVLLLGNEVEDLLAVELVPLLKHCSRNLTIILVSDECSLPLLRRMRREGIFYHALPPQDRAGQAELQLAVKCAFDKARHQSVRKHPQGMREAGCFGA